jgi:UDP-N-acetylglucosamine--N-acetylmuramyl-(pentapeptide) pyrophosphoryl-undecaprenol N-acetylglucosamine transferase
VRLLVTGGGTGGHIYPALAIAQACADRLGADPILFVGARGGMEARLVPEAGFQLALLPTAGLVRKRPAEALASLSRLGAAVVRAVGLVRRFAPDVVVGTGGYAAGPVGLAAVLLGVPLVLQEQNAIPGVTNRLLGRFAACVAVPYPEARMHFPRRTRLLIAGNPVRPEIRQLPSPAEARRRLALPSGGRVTLMMAGSRGSAVFVRLLAEMLPHLREGTLLFVSGRDHHGAAAEAARGHERRVAVVPYLQDMVAGWAAADLVVCRAGAMTLAELATAGRPAVLIPSPHVTHHHQEANAQVFASAGAAAVLAERGLDGRALAEAIGGLLADPQRRAAMAAAARALAQPDALERIAEAVAAAARRPRRRAAT